MGYQKIVVILLCGAFLGCSTIARKTEQALWRVQKSLRVPGEKLISFADTVWEEYQCDRLKRPMIEIETFEVIPRRLSAGESLNQRTIYGLCSDQRVSEITGNLYTRIYFRGRVIVNNRVKRYTLKPGRWQVDTFVDLPENVEKGVYSIELHFKSPKLSVRESQSFIVE